MIPCSAPPNAPMKRQSRTRFACADNAPTFDSSAIITELWGSVISLLLLQLDCLNDIAWKEELDSPVGQDADFPLESRKFGKIDAPPHKPGEQTRKTHGLAPREGYGQFGTGGLMADNA